MVSNIPDFSSPLGSGRGGGLQAALHRAKGSKEEDLRPGDRSHVYGGRGLAVVGWALLPVSVLDGQEYPPTRRADRVFAQFRRNRLPYTAKTIKSGVTSFLHPNLQMKFRVSAPTGRAGSYRKENLKYLLRILKRESE